MNHYPHHIGDFRSGTLHLDRLERWIYRDMIEMYYDTEKPLPVDVAVLCRKLGVRKEEEVAIVQLLLTEFFECDEDGWHHARCDREIQSYQEKTNRAKANGSLGGRPRKPSDNPEEPDGFFPEPEGNPEETGSKTNQEPVTKNQENPLSSGDGAKRTDRPKLDLALIVAAYNELCPTLPRIKMISERRLKAFRSRWLDAGKKLGRYDPGDIDAGITWWRKFFKSVDESAWLSGRNGKWTQCGFDWLINEANFIKVVEGNYIDREFPDA